MWNLCSILIFGNWIVSDAKVFSSSCVERYVCMQLTFMKYFFCLRFLHVCMLVHFFQCWYLFWHSVLGDHCNGGHVIPSLRVLDGCIVELVEMGLDDARIVGFTRSFGFESIYRALWARPCWNLASKRRHATMFGTISMFNDKNMIFLANTLLNTN